MGGIVRESSEAITISRWGTGTSAYQWIDVIKKKDIPIQRGKWIEELE